MSDDQPYYCKQCGKLLGHTTEDGVLVTDRIGVIGGPIYCRYCGHIHLWSNSHRLERKLEQLIRNTMRLRRLTERLCVTNFE
jgi:hypothetical protein